jgi:2-methylcitrate dehydratase PrpD
MPLPFKDQLVIQTLEWLDQSAVLNNDEVTHQAKLLLLDTLACVNAAYSSTTIKELEFTFASHDPGASSINQGPKMSTLSMAQLFAYAACWHEACEGHATAHGRPGIATLASIFPFAHQLTYGQFLIAFIYGYEISVRFAQMLRIKPGMHVDGNWPSLGAAVGAGKCLQLDNAHLLKAINIACTQIPISLYLPIKQGADSRNSFLGHAAVLGIQSAMSAKTSISAPHSSALEYARIALENNDPQWLGEANFEILNAYIKPFASVRHVHYGAFAAMELMDKVDLDHIQNIVLEIYEEATIYCGNRSPETAIQAQFSLSFGIAAVLIFKNLSFEIYSDDVLRHPDVIRIEKIIQIKIHPELTRQKKRGAKLTITDHQQTHIAEVNSILGDRNLPMNLAQIKDKFLHYSKNAVGEKKSHLLWDQVMGGDFSEKADRVLLLSH